MAKKQAHDKAAARKIRSYKFSILNEAVHEEILSFLSNQTLTKMQMITGDRYQQCEPELARYCCKCENDNPVIIAGLCRQCASTEYRWFRRVGRMDKRVILEKYGMPKKDFIFFSCACNQQYDRIELENFMIKTCGSKMEWVRCLAKRDMRKKKARATRKRNEEEADAFLKSLAPGFASYGRAVGIKKMDKDLLRQCSERFVALTSKLQERGLILRSRSTLCSAFITVGVGRIEDVVDGIFS
ncbi:hypothetical protein PC129_g7779 [Phytophthora cactorum]|uniref:Uncharacterized protein n=1 Tax=Phytophthora cactorum TaxID=29920 RepID=A0A329T3R2_9STRA|nr:hypothetical protein Pcac1_g11384 [Phytophthora cactorum]KAG2824956.1 hypothetical protein PC112_g9899 [Phytophthora cactorum]KAG2827760.1 hypothetical protein PC111_g8442 [Phytophthora cactorum]KAG2857865.1 hypothetical protein PC113_g10303 [Phytophthora cactorum]KAG2908199.1 hypothetical protein PC114_g10555 [Phytophthora cactorum]